MSKEERKVPELRFKGFFDDWEQRKLGDLGEVTKLAGFEFTKYVTYSNSGKIIALRGLNIKDGSLVLDDIKYIDESDFSKLNRSKLIKNDILFTYVGTIGHLAVINENDKYYLAPNVARIRMNKSVISKFLSHQMSSTKFYNKIVYPLISTSSQPALSMENVRKFTLQLTKKEEQKMISKFLETIDIAISLHQRKIQILSKLKSQYLHKMFAEKEKFIPELRFNFYEGTWEQRALNSIYKVTMGHSPKSENYTSNPDDYILVQGNADILNGWVTPRVWTTQITSLVKAGSVLISVRAPVGNVGKTAYDIVIGRGIAAIDGEEFLYQLLNKMHLDGYWRRVSTGSTFESINSNDIKKALIKLPVEEERKNIGEFLKKIDSYMALHQIKLDRLLKIKKVYLQKMFI